MYKFQAIHHLLCKCFGDLAAVTLLLILALFPSNMITPFLIYYRRIMEQDSAYNAKTK